MEHYAGKRNKRIALSGAVAVLARCVQVGSTFLSVPLTLKYLGVERFGLWMTISSVLAMAAFADFGIGNGVLNTVAKAFGEDDAVAIRRAVSSGFVILSFIATCVLLCFCLAYPFVNWAGMFRVVSPLAAKEAGPALFIFVVCFAMNIALDTVQRTQLGMQQGYRYAAWQTSGSLAGLLGVLIGVWCHVGLPILVLAIAGAPVLATLINAIHFFGYLRTDLRPAWPLVSKQVIRQIARLGLLFFVLQLAVSIAFSADNLIIARQLGVVHVPEYAIAQRMFAVLSMMTSMLLTPLWPAYGEAVTRKDVVWIRRTLTRSFFGVLAGSAIGASLILLFSHQLLALWVGRDIRPSYTLLFGLAIWSVMDCCGNAVAMYLNGTSTIRFQIIVASVFGVGCMAAKLLLVKRLGVSALPWATIGSYLLLNAIPSAFFVPRMLRKMDAAVHEQIGSSSLPGKVSSEAA